MEDSRFFQIDGAPARIQFQRLLYFSALSIAGCAAGAINWYPLSLGCSPSPEKPSLK